MNSHVPSLLVVAAGGAIGAAARYLFGIAAAQTFGVGFPWGTWGVNLIGGLLMGLLAGSLTRFDEGGEALRLFCGVGILGGFTTFSAFSLDNYNMIVRGEATLALAYATSSVAGSIVMLWAGVALARLL